MVKLRSYQSVLMFLVILLCGVSAVYGAAISGTGGTAKLKDGPNAEGLYFEVDVHYQAFDGLDASDPLGITPGEIQFAYILEYVDGNEEVGFYNVESASGVPIIQIGTSATALVNGVTPGTEAPLGTALITFPSGNPGARFVYSFFGTSQFGGPAGIGDKTVTLVFTSSDANTSGAAYGIVTDNSLSGSGLVIGPVPINPFKPRTPGYWKHQYSGKGRRKEADLLGGYMNDIGVYSEVFRDDLAGDLASDSAYAISTLNNDYESSSMLNKAERQLFAMWLNVVSGKVSYFQEVTFDPADFDTTATTVGEAIEQAEATILDPAATLEELENVKDMLDMLNNQ